MHSDDDNDSSMHDSVEKEAEAEAEAEAEGETETEEHEPFEPITDARTLTIDIQQLNAYLTCGLCCGYLREAYTVMECLHSFCHSCLESYFFEYAHVDDIDCPYNNDHSGPLPNAHLPMVYTRRRRSDSGTLIIESPNTTPTKKGPKIKRSGGGRGTPLRSCHTTFQAADPLRISCRYDRILQQFIDKLLVEYATADEQLKRSIMGDSYTRTTSSGSLQRTNSEVEKKKRSMDEALSGTFIIIEVQPDPHSSLAPLSHPIIKLPSRTCIKHLRKYILQQLKMDESTPLDLVYRAQILGSDHSLEFIKRTRWHQQQYHMTICYRPKAI